MGILRGNLVWWEELALSSMTKDLVTRCLDKNQVTRISLQDVLQHPWLTHTNQENKSVTMKRNKRSFNLLSLEEMDELSSSSSSSTFSFSFNSSCDSDVSSKH